MALPTPPPLFIINPNKIPPFPSLRSLLPPLPFPSPISSHSASSPSFSTAQNPRFLSLRRPHSSLSGDSGTPPESPQQSDEWGEKSEPEASYTRLSDSDPARDDDEWGSDGVEIVNGSAVGGVEEDEKDGRVGGLKRCLVDSVYGTNLGLRAAAEVRAELSELVYQLEAANPTPAPVEAPGLLNGTWVLVYTAFSELLPLLAAGATPLLKVEKISQVIDTSSLTIENSTTLSSPLATVSFSASANFEVRSPSRIQVQFKEGTLKPPEIKSSADLPDSVDVFGQKVNLSPVQRALDPLLEFVASLSRAVSGQPLKIPIPGDRSRSWLITTYLDEDLRISRGDGGLFVLVKEGSPLLVQ